MSSIRNTIKYLVIFIIASSENSTYSCNLLNISLLTSTRNFRISQSLVYQVTSRREDARLLSSIGKIKLNQTIIGVNKSNRQVLPLKDSSLSQLIPLS